MKTYEPRINVLHIEDDRSIAEAFHTELVARNIYFHTVDNLTDAEDVLKKIDVDIVVSDGMFPDIKGGTENKNFIPLASFIKSCGIKASVIAWSNSTHVHEYCAKEGLQSFSKILISREQFREKRREYIEIESISASEMADRVEVLLWKRNGFSERISKLKLKEYYSEPATILALCMAYDMRTGLFEKTAGLNYGPVVTKIENGLFTGYLDEIDEANISKLIYDKILNKKLFPKIQKNVYRRAQKLRSLSAKLRTQNYKKLSDQQLARKYLEFYSTFMEMRMYSSLPTAMEHLTNPWTELLIKTLSEKINGVSELNKALSLLTSPEKPSYVNEYHVAASEIGIRRNKGENIDKSVADLAQRYAWIHYTFEGAPIEKGDVLKTINEIQKTNPDLGSFVQAFKDRPKILKKEKNELIKRYGLSKKEVTLFDIGAEIVYIKFYRKGIFAEAYYSLEFLLDEIGRRIGMSKKEIVQMYPNEVLVVILLKTFPQGLIEQRLKRSCMWGHSGMSYPLGFNSSTLFEKFLIKDVSTQDIKGQVAFVGKISGVVRIINTPEDMKKLKDGEILVSRSTNPSLISAMHRAGAFVTDLGGLTCHAAIVAREMKKPCVVGTKVATKVLKDGDTVEVDAEKGFVKILNL